MSACEQRIFARPTTGIRQATKERHTQTQTEQLKAVAVAAAASDAVAAHTTARCSIAIHLFQINSLSLFLSFSLVVWPIISCHRF